ncbi:MAG: CAP domain-containing protein [Deltaproteobacteria bacterium]|nr:CAP domain-containing protein [Deltaproteobacteria bacterium]
MRLLHHTGCRALLSAILLGAAPAPAPDGGSPESRVEQAIVRAYQEARQPAPVTDPVLAKAAQALAEKGLLVGVKPAIEAESVARVVSEAGGWDPPPRAVAVRASPPERALDSLAQRSDLATSSATRFGLGFARRGSSGTAVLLFVDRRALLKPFPRALEVGQSALLEGEVVFPLYDARVFVTGPAGVQRPEPIAVERRNQFAARVGFPRAGNYTVEVVAQSAKGPEVAALFRVLAGSSRPEAEASPSPAEAEEPEQADQGKAENQVLSALNGRRRAAGLAPLARSSLLDSVATEHSHEMARLGYFAHVSPVSGDLVQRLTRAGFSFQKVAENLGEAASALEAHRAIEASPGHLVNILDPQVELVGIGVARVQRRGTQSVLLTEVFARAPP